MTYLSEKTVPRSAGWVMILAATIGCVSDGPSSVGSAPQPESATLRRFRKTSNEPGPSAVSLIAMPVREDRDASGVPIKVPVGATDPLEFEEVLRSVENSFPLILAVLEEVEIAASRSTSALGGFDTRVKANSFLGLEGFYENETAKVLIEQPVEAWGATFFGGYKIGTGSFPVWDGGLKTREGGEFNAGVRLPLLAGRAIDQRRLRYWKARVAEAAAEPLILQKRLSVTRKAALAYWKWISASQKLRIAERLLGLAQDRQEGIALRVANGDLASIALQENRRLLVERESIVIRSTRQLQATAIELSLYYRDEDGQPQMPQPEEAPEALPRPLDPSANIAHDDVDRALRLRPEIRAIELQLQSLKLIRTKAENDFLPKFDVGVAGSKDVGGVVSDPDDKGPFEFDVFLTFDMPLQRRGARGKSREAQAKTRKLERELQFARDRVAADVRDAESALRQTWLRVALAEENVRLAGTLEEAERLEFRQGESDLLRVNLREQQTASAASTLVDVITEYFRFFAIYRASVGVPYNEVK